MSLESSAVDPAFRELADALRARRATIFDRAAREADAAAHLASLQHASEAVSAAEARLARPVDPDLAHYLSRCSYDKALAWLEQHGG